MVRIKYKKLSDNVIQSQEVTSSNGVSYFARINYALGEWYIFNVKRRNCIKTGNSSNRNVLRRMVRRELQRLGVKIMREFKPSGYAKTKGVYCGE
jgi:hypothetical protein